MNERKRAGARTAVIGLGQMGWALATALASGGRDVVVWTRSGRTGPEGTGTAGSAAEAVERSEVVVVCVTGYDAVVDLLPARLDGKVVVNLSTGGPEQARDVGRLVRGRGGRYADGAIMDTPPGVGRAIVLLSGDDVPGGLAELGAITHLGRDDGLAALHDTALLTLMYGQLTGFLEALALLRADGVPARDALRVSEPWLDVVRAMLPDLAERVDSGDHRSGEARLDMQLAATTHLVEAYHGRGLGSGVLERTAELIRRAVADGREADDLAALVDFTGR
ncbi:MULTISPECIES: NAD(P)-binding domain-containing protein [Actinosynnema]|uniref:NAD(P)-dependent oxidoreductase n=1 Tax=Actinosynnema TaxID=40566 RepID=UPI0020A3E31C|nr:NAD(P)-binding domain-containing protein [Actinosynnema pretiosum]MCP2093075.1 3-hydroxyisobutyrate dehydrogenase [Actinosynnema pretiosum]